MDTRVGEVIDVIDASGLTDDTIFIFASDNGLEYRRPWRGSAGMWTGTYHTAMEGALRVPFIARWPGRIATGRESNEIVHVVELLPTLAQAAGAKLPDDRPLDGVDQTAFFSGAEKSAREGFVCCIKSEMRAAKWRDWKIHFVWEVEPNGGANHPETPYLFNLIQDPKEGSDVNRTQGWVRGPIRKMIQAFQDSLKAHPPISPGAPDDFKPSPYNPGGTLFHQKLKRTGMPTFKVRRLSGNPIIHPHMDERMGANVQGPSLIRVPQWVPNPLGRYYLYFADHKGSYIRLAYADALEGPWQMHQPGALQLSESCYPVVPVTPTPAQAKAPRETGRPGLAPEGTPGIPDAMEDAVTPHIASPDVHVDHANRRIVMYYHGLQSFRTQLSRVALSADGLRFEAREELLGPSYFRVFHHSDFTYALAMPGIVFRSRDGLSGFERGPALFDPLQRHTALLRSGDTLFVFWTRVGDVPERIYCSPVDLSPPWTEWKAGDAIDVLRPEQEWEGAGLPLALSYRGAIGLEVNQVRDPAIFEEDGRIYLLYAVKGEAGIAIAELQLQP